MSGRHSGVDVAVFHGGGLVMRVTILCVGTLKENYWKMAMEEYAKRCKPYADWQVVEVKESRLPNHPTEAQIREALEEEGRKLLSQIPDRASCISLCIEGKTTDSVVFSKKLQQWMQEGDGHVVFVIGGSDGLSEAVKRRSDFRLSFSPMTLPHQLMRVVLAEQIYRAWRIWHGQPYHK